MSKAILRTAALFILVSLMGTMSQQPPPAAHADNPWTVEIPLGYLAGEPAFGGIALSGLIGSQTLELTLGEDEIVLVDGWLDLVVMASDLLDEERASLTVALNDTPLASRPVQELATVQRITIPAGLLRPGKNSLSFTGRLYLPGDDEDQCSDWLNPSRWLLISPESALHLSVQTSNSPPDLAQFPRPFVWPETTLMRNRVDPATLFVLPPQPAGDDLTALATIAFVLGEAGVDPASWQVSAIHQPQFTQEQAAGRHLVFIGPAQSQLWELPPADKPFVAVAASPWSAERGILVIGDDDQDDGQSPAFALANPTQRLLLRGGVAYLDNLQPASPRSLSPMLAAGPVKEITFADLGYDERAVRGLGTYNLTYRIYLPGDVQITAPALKLVLTHSPTLDPDNSAVTVYVNGFAVAGVLLDANNANLTPIPVSLPAARFRPGYNYLRLTFNLQMPYNTCEAMQESAWATVHRSSTLLLSYKRGAPPPTLDTFPQPFSDRAGVTLVLPDNPDPITLQQVAQLAALLGQAAHPKTTPPRVVTASNFYPPDDAARPHTILIGRPGQNAVIREINNLLPQPFAGDGTLRPGYGVYLPTAAENATMGLLQIIHSPWTDNGSVLVLTAAGHPGLEWSWDLLLDPERQDQLAGNLVAIGSDGRSQAQPAAEQEPEMIPQQMPDASGLPIIGPLLQKVSRPGLTLSLLAVGAALGLVLGTIWLWRRFGHHIRERFAKPGGGH